MPCWASLFFYVVSNAYPVIGKLQRRVLFDLRHVAAQTILDVAGRTWMSLAIPLGIVALQALPVPFRILLA